MKYLDIPDEGSLLYQACQIVASKIDVKIPKVVARSEELETICHACGIHTRKVSLKEFWWKENRGAFLGYYGEDQRPVALIYGENNQYELVDPKTGQRKDVDQESLQALSSQSVMFYRPIPEGTTTLRQLLFFGLQGRGKEYVALGITGLLSVLIAFFFPLANKILFDTVITTFNISLFKQVVIGLFVATFSIAILGIIRSMTVLRLQGLLMNRYQIGLWDRILKLPVRIFREIPAGDFVQRTFIFEEMRQLFQQGTIRVLFNGFFGIAYLAVMFFYSWQLAFIGLGVTLLTVFVSLLFFLLIQQIQRILLESNAKIYAFLTQIVHGISKLRVAAAEEPVFLKWQKAFIKNQRLSYRIRQLRIRSQATNAVLGLLSRVLVIGTVIWMFSVEVNGTSPMTIGTFLAFNAAYVPFTASISSAVGVLISLITVIPFWERAKPLLETLVETPEGKRDPGQLEGNISAENLYFRYDLKEDPILNDISFKITSGEFIGIVGHSGCGKSTLCRLLVGFENLEKGSLSYDQKDLENLDITKVREQLGVILQNTAIFSGTIYENIACGASYTPEQVQKAVSFTAFDADLAELPMGLDTILPPGGDILSGGQRQKLLLTRVLLKQPNVLILDEATNALDFQTEKKIFERLQILTCTRIVVAHRLHTLRQADQILVMEQGKIIDSGTFESLEKSCPLFVRLLERQKL